MLSYQNDWLKHHLSRIGLRIFVSRKQHILCFWKSIRLWNFLGLAGIWKRVSNGPWSQIVKRGWPNSRLWFSNDLNYGSFQWSNVLNFQSRNKTWRDRFLNNSSQNSLFTLWYIFPLYRYSLSLVIWFRAIDYCIVCCIKYTLKYIKIFLNNTDNNGNQRIYFVYQYLIIWK